MTTSNYKSDRSYVTIWGQLKDLEISEYKCESKGCRQPIRKHQILYVILKIKGGVDNQG